MQLARLIAPLAFLTCLLPGLAAPAAADEASPGPDRTLSPYFFVDGGDPTLDRMPLASTDVEIDIAGVIAEVTVRQTYTNEGSRPINARYVFPASTRAAVHGMRMRIGDQVIEARIREREVARQEYETARKQGKSASLLEQQRPNAFTMRVANVLPGDRVEVELRYTELLVPTDGVYELVYPTIVGPRYAANAEGGDHDRWVANPYLLEGQPPVSTFRLRGRVATGVPLFDLASPSHDVIVDWRGSSEADVSLAPSDGDGGNRDFVLRFRLAGEAIAQGLLVHRGADENVFLLMVQPPGRVTDAVVPPREYVFIVDVSGSMNGYPLDTVKLLLRDLVGSLRSTDSFNVILFSGTQALMAPRSVPATPANVTEALRTIDRQRGGGGTELLAAIRRAMSLEHQEGTSRSFVVVTDGYISAERSVFRYIRENLGQANVFAFGIGNSVNRHLIEGIARAGMGEPFVVTGPAEAPAAANRFKDYVQFPVLTDIEIDFGGLDVYDVEPAGLPDLLAERPLIVHGKWRGTPDGPITLSGRGGAGPYRETLDVSGAASGTSHAALPYFWARTRIAELSEFNSGHETADERAEITRLGLTYNLLTRHTSFVAVHHVVRNPDDPARDVTQPLPLPAGVSNAAVGAMGVGSEPDLAILLGVLAATMLAAWLVRRSAVP